MKNPLKENLKNMTTLPPLLKRQFRELKKTLFWAVKRLRKGEPKAVFLTIFSVFLLIFAGIFSFVFHEQRALSFSSEVKDKWNDNETEKRGSAFEPKTLRKRFTITSENFEATARLQFPKQSEISNATVRVTPTKMQSGIEYLQSTYSFHSFEDLNKDGIVDRISLINPNNEPPLLEFLDRNSGRKLIFPLEDFINQLKNLSFSSPLKIGKHGVLTFSPYLSSLSEDVRELLTYLSWEDLYQLQIYTVDFNHDSYPDFVLVLKNFYLILYLENKGKERFFESPAQDKEKIELLSLFDVEAIFNLSTMRNPDLKIDFTPFWRDVNYDAVPEFFIFFNLTSYSSNTSVKTSSLTSFALTDSSAWKPPVMNGEFQISSGMLLFKETKKEIKKLPVFLSNRLLNFPTILQLPEEQLKTFEVNNQSYIKFNIMIFPAKIYRYEEKVPVSSFLIKCLYFINHTSTSYKLSLHLLQMGKYEAIQIDKKRYSLPLFGIKNVPVSFLYFDEEGTELLVGDEEETLLIPLKYVTEKKNKAIDIPFFYTYWDETYSGDINGDGATDLVVKVAGGSSKVETTAYIYIYIPEERAMGRFQLVETMELSQGTIKENLGVDISSYSQEKTVFFLADLTADGAAELIFVKGNNIFIFKNKLSPSSPPLKNVTSAQIYHHYCTHKGNYTEPPYLMEKSSVDYLSAGSDTPPLEKEVFTFVKDVDGDGDIDITAFEKLRDDYLDSSSSVRAILYINDGEGNILREESYQLKNYLLQSGTVVKKMSFDFYNDNTEEMVVLYRKNGVFYLEIYTKTSEGVFLTSPRLRFSGLTIYDFFLSDFNNDGLSDIIFRDSTSYSFSFYQHKKWWQFEKVPPHAIPLFVTAEVLQVAAQGSLVKFFSFHDFDKDGKNEICIVKRTILPPYGYTLYLFKEKAGNGTEKASLFIYELIGSDMFFSIVDMNTDGVEEVVITFPERFVIAEIDVLNWSLSLKNDIYIWTDTLRIFKEPIKGEVFSQPQFTDLNSDGYKDILFLIKDRLNSYLNVLLYFGASFPPVVFSFFGDYERPVAIRLLDFDLDGNEELVLFTNAMVHFVRLKRDGEVNVSEIFNRVMGYSYQYMDGNITLDEFNTLVFQTIEEMKPLLEIVGSFFHYLPLSESEPPELAVCLNLSEEGVSKLSRKIKMLSSSGMGYHRKNLLSFVDFMLMRDEIGKTEISSLTSKVYGYPQIVKFYISEPEETGLKESLFSVESFLFQSYTVDVKEEIASYVVRTTDLKGLVEVPFTFILGNRESVYGSSRFIFDVYIEIEYVVPELAVEEVHLTGKMVEGEKIEVRVKVKNIGAVKAQYFSVSLLVDDEVVEKKGVGSLVSGEVKNVSFEWKPALFSGRGKHYISVKVDQDDEIGEYEKWNNFGYLSVEVKENRLYTTLIYSLLIFFFLFLGFFIYGSAREWWENKNYEEGGERVRYSEEMLNFMKKEKLPFEVFKEDYRSARASLLEKRVEECISRAERVTSLATEVVEKAMPDFSILYPDEVHTDLAVWCNIPIKVVNTGKAPANWVKVRILGNVKLMDNLIPFELRQGEEKEMVFGIYPHRYGLFNLKAKIRFSKPYPEEKEYLYEIDFTVRCLPPQAQEDGSDN